MVDVRQIFIVSGADHALMSLKFDVFIGVEGTPVHHLPASVLRGEVPHIFGMVKGVTRHGFFQPSVPELIIGQAPDDFLGEYNDSTGGENISFLKEIQQVFGEKINLEKYTNPLTTKIENSEALILQETSAFSPFLCANYYDLGLSSSATVKIGSIYSENK